MPLHMEEIKGKTFNKFQSLQLDWLHMKGTGVDPSILEKCVSRRNLILNDTLYSKDLFQALRHRNQRKH